MAVPIIEFQVRGFRISKTKNECVHRKLKYRLKWNDGKLSKIGTF